MGCILVHRPPFPKFSFLQLYWNRSDEGLNEIPVLFLKWSFLSLLTNEILSVLMTSQGPHLSWWHHHFSCGSSFSAYDVYPRLQTHWRPGLFVSLDHDGIHQPPCLLTKVSLIKIQFIQYVFYPFFFLVEKAFFPSNLVWVHALWRDITRQRKITPPVYTVESLRITSNWFFSLFLSLSLSTWTVYMTLSRTGDFQFKAIDLIGFNAAQIFQRSAKIVSVLVLASTQHCHTQGVHAMFCINELRWCIKTSFYQLRGENTSLSFSLSHSVFLFLCCVFVSSIINFRSGRVKLESFLTSCTSPWIPFKCVTMHNDILFINHSGWNKKRSRHAFLESLLLKA